VKKVERRIDLEAEKVSEKNNMWAGFAPFNLLSTNKIIEKGKWVLQFQRGFSCFS